jgi:uncharacterized protein (TIGR00251 family)
MILHLIVKPNAKTDEIIRQADGSFKIRIKARPVDGKANQYLVAYLSKILGVPKSNIVLTTGETSSFKTIEIFADERFILNKLPKISS